MFFVFVQNIRLTFCLIKLIDSNFTLYTNETSQVRSSEIIHKDCSTTWFTCL